MDCLQCSQLPLVDKKILAVVALQRRETVIVYLPSVKKSYIVAYIHNILFIQSNVYFFLLSFLIKFYQHLLDFTLHSNSFSTVWRRTKLRKDKLTLNSLQIEVIAHLKHVQVLARVQRSRQTLKRMEGGQCVAKKCHRKSILVLSLIAQYLPTESPPDHHLFTQ